MPKTSSIRPVNYVRYQHVTRTDTGTGRTKLTLFATVDVPRILSYRACAAQCCRQVASHVSHTSTDGGAWCHDIGYPLLDAEHSLCTAPWSGTPCRTTSAHSRNMSPLDRAWKPGFSPDTSVFSALETLAIIALYKSTFTIPYHTNARKTARRAGPSARAGTRSDPACTTMEINIYHKSVHSPATRPAVNMTLYAHLQHGTCSYQSISAADAGAQQQTRRPPLLLSIDGTDRRTDERTPDQSSQRVYFVWPDPTQPISWLTQPNPTHYKWKI